MTSPTKTAWWQKQLPRLRSEVAALLRAKVDGSAADDLTQEVMVDLLRYLEAEGSDFEADPGDDDGPTWWRLRAIARSVARRRLSDAFRQKIRERLRQERHPTPTPASPHDRVAHLRAVLASVLRGFDTLTPGELQAVLRVSTPGPEGALSQLERKRLSRARQKLAAHVAEELGPDALEPS